MIERHTASKWVPSARGDRRKGPTWRMTPPSTGSACVRWAIARRAPRGMVGGVGNGNTEKGATEKRWVPIDSFGTHRITSALDRHARNKTMKLGSDTDRTKSTPCAHT